MKKYTLIALCLLSTSALADSNTGFYMTPGTEFYNVRDKDVALPISFGDGAFNHDQSYGSSDHAFSGYRMAPSIDFGYRFKDTMISVNAHVFYQKSTGTDYDNTEGSTGYYWRISGGEVPENDVYSNYIDSQAISNQTYFLDTKFFVSVHEHISDRFNVEPRVGMAVTRMYSGYNYMVLGKMYGPTETPYNVQGKQSVDTMYAGPMFGLKANFKVTKSIGLFADFESQFLHASSHMKATQNMDYSVHEPEESVTDSNSTFTKRYKLTAGVDFYLNKSQGEYSPKVTAYVGFDSWGYIASIENPNRSGDSATHIEDRSTINNFAGISFYLPIN